MKYIKWCVYNHLHFMEKIVIFIIIMGEYILLNGMETREIH